jgi:hypothetical protein
MRVSKYAKVDVNILLEWIYDDDNYIIEDYKIVVDTIHETRTYAQAPITGVIPSATGNKVDWNLFLLNDSQRKWTTIDSEKYPFIQVQDYPGNVPTRYDILRIHFPVNYNFQDKVGCLLSIKVFDAKNQKYIYLSNFFFDKSDTTRNFELEPAFSFQEKLWGKYLEIQVPSTYRLSREINPPSSIGGSLVPKTGTANYNLSSDGLVGLSTTSPILIDFRFITHKEISFGRTTYTVNDPFSTSFPQVPEFENVGVAIKHATDGDYFEIYGTFNNNISDFGLFMRQEEMSGRPKYIVFTITVFEKNIKTEELDYFVRENFVKSIRYRPIITYSTTTAVLDVTMKVHDIVSEETPITRRATYTMLQDEVAKFGKNMTKINVKNAFKPKIYNALPDQLLVSHQLNETENAQLPMGNSSEGVKVPYPVMTERFNIVAKNKSQNANETTYFGMGDLQIMLYPSDNVVTFLIAQNVDQKGVTPFKIEPTGRLKLVFKSNTQIVESDLFGDNKLDIGQVSFRISESQMNTISDIKKAGFDQFYIVFKPETGVNTTVYAGFFLIHNLK